VELAEGEGQSRPLVVGQATGAHPVRIEAADGCEHPHGQLGAPHFHGKHPHRQAAVHAYILGNIEGERGLAHGRTTGDDDQVAGLEPGSLLVEIGEPGGDTGDVRRIVPVVQFLNPFDDLGEQGIDVHEAVAVAGTGLGNGEDLRFGLVEEALRIPSQRIEGIGGDFIGDGHQLPQHRPFTDDFRIALDVGRRRRVGRQFPEIGQSPGAIPLPGGIQGFGHGHHVGGFARLQ